MPGKEIQTAVAESWEGTRSGKELSMVLKEWGVERDEKKQLMSRRRQEHNRKKLMMEKLRVERGTTLDNAPVIPDLPEPHPNSAVSTQL